MTSLPSVQPLNNTKSTKYILWEKVKIYVRLWQIVLTLLNTD